METDQFKKFRDCSKEFVKKFKEDNKNDNKVRCPEGHKCYLTRPKHSTEFKCKICEE